MHRTLLIGRPAGRSPSSESDDLSGFSHPPRESPGKFTNHHRETGRRPQPPSTLASHAPATIHFTCYRARRAYHYSLVSTQSPAGGHAHPYKPSLHPLHLPSPLPPSFPAAAAAIYQASYSGRRLDSPGPLRSRRGRESSSGSSRHVVGAVHGLLALAVDHPALPPHRRPPHPLCRRRRTGEVSHRPSPRPRLLLPPLLRVGSDRALEKRIGASVVRSGEHRSFHGLNLV